MEVEWISVKDRLPEEHTHLEMKGSSEEVLILSNNGAISIERYLFNYKFWTGGLGATTHWTPLPELP